jgi:hypothetical protein
LIFDLRTKVFDHVVPHRVQQRVMARPVAMINWLTLPSPQPLVSYP